MENKAIVTQYIKMNGQHLKLPEEEDLELNNFLYNTYTMSMKLKTTYGLDLTNTKTSVDIQAVNLLYIDIQKQTLL